MTRTESATGASERDMTGDDQDTSVRKKLPPQFATNANLRGVDADQKNDVVLLHRGNRLAAFGRLLKTNELRVALADELRNGVIGVVGVDCHRDRIHAVRAAVIAARQFTAFDRELQWRLRTINKMVLRTALRHTKKQCARQIGAPMAHSRNAKK